MWIFCNDKFMSVVLDRHNPKNFLVRSRFEGDLEKAFPGVEVIELEEADYRFRVSVPKKKVRKLMDREINSIDYFNFKDSIADKERKEVYTRVWLQPFLHQIEKQDEEIFDFSDRDGFFQLGDT